MREKLKNDLLLLLDTYINASALSEIDQKLNVMLLIIIFFPFHKLK